MKLFDLHCDTAYEMFKNKAELQKNSLAISLDRTGSIEDYRQVFAVWSDADRTDEQCYDDFFRICKNFRKYSSLFPANDRFYLSVEDARLLCGDIERLNCIYELGVRFLIPVWKGKNIIGGAFDIEEGLTDFGKKVICQCFRLGIIPDISHSSVNSSEDIFSLAEKCSKPVIASHSCSYSVYEHPRNLRDSQFSKIRELGGVVGLSFCNYHLTSEKEICSSENILRHVDHYLNIGGEDILCIGADMDGAPMPRGINGIEDINCVYDKIRENFGKDISDKITFQNAYNFIKTNIKR